jgi:Domain of unknown function (DUF1707)/Cell wall-active antibiotics response 4TMS YvqF
VPSVGEQPELPAIRASDAEREDSVTVLREAVVQGRLTLEEFSDRVSAAQAARTDRELAALIADLPATAVAVAGDAPTKYRATFSQLVRSGAWELPPRSSWRTLFGTIEIDLREVHLTGPELELDVYSLFGTVTIRVPPGIAVQVDGGGAFASQIIEPPSWPALPDAPRLRIQVKGPGGTLYVRSSEPRSASPRLPEPRPGSTDVRA